MGTGVRIAVHLSGAVLYARGSWVTGLGCPYARSHLEPLRVSFQCYTGGLPTSRWLTSFLILNATSSHTLTLLVQGCFAFFS